MAFLFRQKLDLRELVEIPGNEKIVVIADPQEYFLALYSYYLAKNDFNVKNCNKLDDLESLIIKHRPHLLIFSPHFYKKISNSARVLRILRRKFPYLQIITISCGIDSEQLKELISCGIAGHIERRFTKPMDIVAVARSILNN